MHDVIVVGGGASGMMAAIAAARRGASVLILEHMDCCGKKILSTGNGKCNYTNTMQGIEYYRGDDPAFVLPALERFGAKEAIQFFREIGIEPKEKNGYVYPRSMQATAVRDALLCELAKNKVEIRTNIGIRAVSPVDGSYEICTKNGDFHARNCILATGGKSAKFTGSDGSGFLYLGKLSHTVTDLVPALVGMNAKVPFLRKLAGIRAEARVDLLVENRQIASDQGEVQLTDYGISGIPVFQVSRFAAKALQDGKTVGASVNFLPSFSQEEGSSLIERRFQSLGERCAKDALIGLVHSKLAEVALECAQIPLGKVAGSCSKEELRRLSGFLLGLDYPIVGMRAFEQSQVTAGGVCTSQIHADTMESKLHPGLFFAGEMIDIDGMCGGYNLQWAWSSGFLAGSAAAARCDAAERKHSSHAHGQEGKEDAQKGSTATTQKNSHRSHAHESQAATPKRALACGGK